MKKIILNDYIDYSFFLAGICYHDDDFKLCWQLNKALELDFERVQDVDLIEPKQKALIQFACFHYYDAEAELDYYLISNRADSNFLIPEQTKTDFFLRIDGDSVQYNESDIIRKIKNIPKVLTSFKIEPDSLKSIENIII
jgi:hypothetical protein